MAPKNLKYASLCDIYGGLLSEKQRDALEMYYSDDLSLSEISEHMGITRQGVRDQIKHAEEELNKLEDKLRLYERNSSVAELSNIIDIISRLASNSCDFKEIEIQCSKAREIIGKIGFGDDSDFDITFDETC